MAWLYNLLLDRLAERVWKFDAATSKMRRRAKGRWEYREPTREELEEVTEWQAIR